jgi:Peptidase family M1 domain/Secretion system C-terminal sorting domain
MKPKFYLVAVVLFFAQICFAQNPDNETYHRHASGHLSAAGASSTGNSGTGANIDVVYYRCDWTISPNVSANISGTVTTYFKTTAANVSVITFDLNNLVFGSPVAKYHGSTVTSSFPSTDIYRVTLPSAISAMGTLDSVSITYSGTPPAVSGQEEGYQRKQDGLANWYIYTLSESYEDKDWWPCKADMQDKADSLDINLTVPWTGTNTYWAAANGKLTDSAISGVTRTFKFKHRYPIATYLVGIGVAKYNRYYRGTVNIAGKDVPVVYNIYPDMTGATLTTALNRMDISKTELAEFSNKYGPYPFADEKHGYYQHGWGGGIEHQTFSGMSSGSMSSWSVIAHELAHQWWGDKVTFATWNHLWLAEGFAKYSEALAAELIPAIGVTAASHMSGIKTTARATNTTPVYLSNASIANSNTVWTTNNDNAIYQRGAIIVSMLRAMMGDANFFQGCRDYLNDPLLAYKSATTADLQRNMENQLSGIDLTPFFSAWVNGTGRTDYTGNYYISGNDIQFTLTQSRTPAANPFMPMPVVLKIRNAASTKDTTVVIYHYAAGQLGYAGSAGGMGASVGSVVSYKLSFIPAAVTVDPDSKTMANGTITVIATPLDVNILNFSANKTTAGNKINLSLAGNEVIDKVVLLKSDNGIDFVDAGIMVKTNTSGSANNYQFTDVLPFSNITYYRAKIYTSNKQEYSGIAKVEQAGKKILTVSPNPATDVFNISFDNISRDKATVRVTNAEGKTVIESSTQNNFIHFDVSHLPAGIYMVQVMQQGKITETNKFLVRH